MTDPQDMDYNAINESFPEQTRVIDLQFIPNAMISFKHFQLLAMMKINMAEQIN